MNVINLKELIGFSRAKKGVAKKIPSELSVLVIKLMA